MGRSEILIIPSVNHSSMNISKRFWATDNTDINRMFPGYGHTDFFGIVRELKKRNYQNYLSFECLNEPSLAVVREKSGRWIETLRRL